MRCIHDTTVLVDRPAVLGLIAFLTLDVMDKRQPMMRLDEFRLRGLRSETLADRDIKMLVASWLEPFIMHANNAFAESSGRDLIETRRRPLVGRNRNAWQASIEIAPLRNQL